MITHSPRACRALLFLAWTGLAWTGALAHAQSPADGGTDRRAQRVAQPHPAVTMEYLANEGVLLTAGGTSVLIDGLFGDGLPNYATVAPRQRDSLEQALGRFGDLDLVLVTHVHRDHFNAGAVARHLAANPEATFIGPRQALDSLAALAGWRDPSRGVALVPPAGGVVTLERNGVVVQALGIPHPPSRNDPVEHVVYALTIGETRVVHLGDSNPGEADVALLPKSPDLLLAPYWILRGSALVDAVRPRRLAAFHLQAEPTPTPDYLAARAEVEILRRGGELISLMDSRPGAP